MPTLFPPVPPACSCSAQAVLDFGTPGRFNNFLLNTDLSADQCEMTVSCENWQDIVGTLQVRYDGSRLASGKTMKAKCDMGIKMWRVKVDGQNNYINATLLEYMCSYIPAKYAD
ncbi:hypothetical protein CAEBREN_11900 [Caenorhabditis brenneri]|uniref:Uncharacterized protein n=1 Tax=Caenorhabditis brenneri TaxID=135651 RepID=G0P1X6_CAEBE|nr:hypothetical protein CAEBREN_11900 [Caenorhabditis brenneri]